MTDWVFMDQKGSYTFITGPEVIRTVIREEIDLEPRSLSDFRSDSNLIYAGNMVKKMYSKWRFEYFLLVFCMAFWYV